MKMTFTADRLAAIGRTAVRLLASGSTPTAEAVMTEAPNEDAEIGRVGNLLRETTARLGHLDAAKTNAASALSDLRDLAESSSDKHGAIATRVRAAADRIATELAATESLPSMLTRYAESIEAGVAVASYPAPAKIRACPGRGDRTDCGAILPYRARLCAICRTVAPPSKSAPTK